MNNIFSFPRFWKYSISKILSDKTFYLMAILVNTLLYILLSVLVYSNYISVKDAESIFFQVLNIYLIVFAGLSFKEFHRKGISNQAFTLPASKLEKFMHIMLLNVIILPLLVSLSFPNIIATNVTFKSYSSDTLQESVNSDDKIVGSATKTQHSSFAGAKMSTTTTTNYARTNPGMTIDNYIAENNVWYTFTLILIQISYMFLCSVLFRKRQILWGIIMISMVFIILIYLMSNYFDKIQYLEDLLNNTELIAYIFSLLFVWVAWLRFRKLQIK